MELARGSFQDENSIASCKKYHSLAHASKNLYVFYEPHIRIFPPVRGVRHQAHDVAFPKMASCFIKNRHHPKGTMPITMEDNRRACCMSVPAHRDQLKLFGMCAR